MKGNIARITQAVLFVTVICISMASAANAQTPKCNPALIAGKWATSVSGIFGGAHFVAVELADIDAEGNFTSKITVNLNGTSWRGMNIGKITANADCTATSSWTHYVVDESGNKTAFGTGTAEMVAADDMRETRFVFTSYTLADGTNLPVTVKGEGRKVFPRNSDQQ